MYREKNVFDWQFFDSMIVSSIDKEWSEQPIKNLSTGNCFEPP